MEKETIKKTTSEEHEILMQSMRDNREMQNGPKVGMFWYNPERNRLVGVRSMFASELRFNEKGRKSVKIWHHTTWPEVREEALALGSTDAIWQEEDYTMVPRGRVFQLEVPNSDAEYYEIYVGSWIYKYPDAKQLIVTAFNLENSDYTFTHIC